MDNKSALIILRQMHETAAKDAAALNKRLVDLDADYAKDPWEDTAVQISRIAARLTRKQLEADALAVAVAKF